jgi:hypothetical protein
MPLMLRLYNSSPHKMYTAYFVSFGNVNIRLLNEIDMEVTHLRRNESSHLDGSPYEKAKTMAKRASNTLAITTHAARVARIELFFFLPILVAGSRKWSKDSQTRGFLRDR